MACIDLIPQIDDESFALQLQLEEIEAQRQLQSGKWPENSPPDFVSGFDDFETELKKMLFLVEDLKFAHSIAKAVVSDAVAIEELRLEESQSVQDREFARSLNTDAILPSQDLADTPEMSRLGAESVDWDHVLQATEASTCSNSSSCTVAGPSTDYTFRQKIVLDHLPQLKVECVVCGDAVHPHTTVRLACNDVYCKSCLTSFLLRVAKDESLFPPTCHRQRIENSLIETMLSVEELATYRKAELEFSSTNRIYCASLDCGEFIPLPSRAGDSALCEACGAETCVLCKALAHGGRCPADEARQSLIDLANEEGWKACFGCGEMVYRYLGCDHITCRCSAEFCYRCGVKWKECQCGDWEPELLDQRAQQIVDREALRPLAPAVRQQRVVAMARELQTNHECDHSGKFTKIEGSRRGRVCEMCGTRHRKYILSCKRCHMLACEDCRRHRV